MTDIEAPRVPGISTGIVALSIAVMPAVWISTYLVLGGFSGTASFRESMLVAEPFALPILGAVALVIALAALWRDTRGGRILAIIAIAAVVLQTAAIVALLLL